MMYTDEDFQALQLQVTHLRALVLELSYLVEKARWRERPTADSAFYDVMMDDQRGRGR